MDIIKQALWGQISTQTLVIIIMLVGLLVFFFVAGNALTGGKLGRALACAILFWIPYGALAIALTHACAAIPV